MRGFKYFAFTEGGVEAGDERTSYPALYDKDGNKIEFETRCAVCLRGLCKGARAVKLKNRDMWGVFVPMCPYCSRDLKEGRELVERHNRRQIDMIENGDYEGFEF